MLRKIPRRIARKTSGSRDAFCRACHTVAVEGLEARTLLAVTPFGPEFRVNTCINNDQYSSAIAMDADGDFVIAWQSEHQDGSSYGIYAQRFNADGQPQGVEFRVNTYTNSYQAFPDLAMDTDGDFVIAWQSYGPDDSDQGIYAQRYNAAGEPQGGEFRVNTCIAGSQRNPSVAMDANGSFVIAWDSANQDGSGFGVYAQSYNAAGVPQGSEFRVNTYTTDHQFGPAIAMNANGDFVIAWTSQNQDGSSSGIYAQRYSAAGEPQGAEFPVNTYTVSDQFSPTVGINSDGDFVIAWQSWGQDNSIDNGVYAQR